MPAKIACDNASAGEGVQAPGARPRRALQLTNRGDDMLEGLAQDFQLTLPYILRRAEQLYGYREIVTRRPDKSLHRHTFADFVSRSKKLAVALGELGLEHLPAPGGVLRRPLLRGRAAHPEPPSA